MKHASYNIHYFAGVDPSGIIQLLIQNPPIYSELTSTVYISSEIPRVHHIEYQTAKWKNARSRFLIAQILKLLRRKIEIIPVVRSLLDELLRKDDGGMENEFIVISVDPSDGVLFDMSVLVAALPQQNEGSDDLLQQSPDLFLAQDNIRVLFGEKVLVEGNSLLEDIRSVGVDEYGTDVALHEDFLGQTHCWVDYQIFSVIFLRGGHTHEGLLRVGEEGSGYSSLLQV